MKTKEKIEEEWEEEDEEVECSVCGGWGEFSSLSYRFTSNTCSACHGTGIEQEYEG